VCVRLCLDLNKLAHFVGVGPDLVSCCVPFAQTPGMSFSLTA
jgi:hypothetical protein